jgi:AbrB family looped-hinge helix DNA binding protein
MRTTIDAAGRLVIPSAVRRQAGLRPGMPLEVRWRDGRIEIEPAPLLVRLERRGRLLVAVPQEEVQPLAATAVEAAREALRDERAATD